MKGLIIAASMIASSAFASNSVTHGYTEVLGAIKLNNACLTESEVKSINPVTVCTKLEAVTTGHGGQEGTQTQWRCVAHETKELSYSRLFQKTFCVEYAPLNEGSSVQCLKWNQEAYFLPETILTTLRISRGEVETETSTWFTFPICN